jgi:hypothetical protein
VATLLETLPSSWPAEPPSNRGARGIPPTRRAAAGQPASDRCSQPQTGTDNHLSAKVGGPTSRPRNIEADTAFIRLLSGILDA